MASNKKIELKDIPIMPQVATKILQLQEDNLKISFKDLERVILVDPALTAKILKVANSALYARQKEVTSLQQAITLLGFKMVKSMVLLVCASNIYKKKTRKLYVPDNTPESLSSATKMWHHLITTAFISRHIAISLDFQDLKEDAFIAGLLHDIGRMAFLLNHIDLYEAFLEEIITSHDINILTLEEKHFGYNHCEAGKYIFQKWNFPDEYIDAVSQHHTSFIDSPYDRIVRIVAIANIYARLVNNEIAAEDEKELLESNKKILGITQEQEQHILTDFYEEIKNSELFTISSEML